MNKRPVDNIIDKDMIDTTMRILEEFEDKLSKHMDVYEGHPVNVPQEQIGQRLAEIAILKLVESRMVLGIDEDGVEITSLDGFSFARGRIISLMQFMEQHSIVGNFEVLMDIDEEAEDDDELLH